MRSKLLLCYKQQHALCRRRRDRTYDGAQQMDVLSAKRVYKIIYTAHTFAVLRCELLWPICPHPSGFCHWPWGKDCVSVIETDMRNTGLDESTKLKLLIYYIMAGRAFVGAKEDFIIKTVVFWHWDNGGMTENNSFGVNSAMSIIICTWWLILIT